MSGDGLQNSKHKMQTMLANIDSGIYRIPDFQRDYVWKKKQVTRLLDSIFHDYPAGALLILSDSNNKLQMTSKPFYGVDDPKENCQYYVLDGQQRLTSCYHVFYDKSKSYRYFIDLKKLFEAWKKNNDRDSIDFLSCIKTRANTAKTNAVQGDLLPFSLIRTQESYSKQRTAYADKIRNDSDEYLEFINIKLDSLLKPFIDYEFSSVDLSESLKMPAICRIFETLNNTGMKLDSFDICVAKFMGNGINLKNKISESKKTYPSLAILFKNNQYREMPLQVIALAHDADSHLKNKLVDTIKPEMLEFWDESIKALDSAMRILDNAGVGTLQSLKILPYPAMIPVIAASLISSGYYGRTVPEKSKINDMIHKYYYTSCLMQRYNQGGASTMKEDFDLLTEWFNKSLMPEFIAEGVQWNDETMCRIKNNYGAIACAFYSIINTSSPKDFMEKTEVKAFEPGVELHHVFPKNHYEKIGLDVNRALNMAFLLKDTNDSISTEATGYYLDLIIKDVFSGNEDALKSIMESHMIDKDCYGALKNEDYDKFITLRMNSIVSKLTTMGVVIHKVKKEDLGEDYIADLQDSEESKEEDSQNIELF